MDSKDTDNHSANETSENENDEPQQSQEDRAADLPKTIFVGNLITNIKKSHIIKLFLKFGEIKSVRLRTCTGKKAMSVRELKKVTSMNAYVVFQDEKSAHKALELNGTEYKTKHIRVKLADKQRNLKNDKHVIFVGNLKYSVTDEDLYEVFSTCGEIDYVRTIRNEKGCKGIAYVGFKKSESVHLSFELNGHLIEDRPIRVQRYNTNQKEIKVKKSKGISKNQQTARSQNYKNYIDEKINKKQKPKDKSYFKNPDNLKPKFNDKINKKLKQNIKNTDGSKINVKKSKGLKVYEGKKAERTKKKSKLGKGLKMKKILAKKLAPRPNK